MIVPKQHRGRPAKHNLFQIFGPFERKLRRNACHTGCVPVSFPAAVQINLDGRSIGAIAVLPTCQYLNLFQSSCVALAFAWRNHRGKDHKKGDTNFYIGFHISFMGKKNDFAKSLCREQIESYIKAIIDQHPARFLKVCLNQTCLWT